MQVPRHTLRHHSSLKGGHESWASVAGESRSRILARTANTHLSSRRGQTSPERLITTTIIQLASNVVQR
eukprot:18895-Eustigmatos_ZCMA.PRE.1